jgi:hypothetical protein
MLPALRALFNEPRRLWAGKGTKMQGYGQKKSISGVQATGTGGVLTLGRSDKSGTTPDQGSAEEPVELRAGQGVRLHGYGGIHTLERLPVPPVEDKPILGTARLEWDIEVSRGYATLCHLGESSENPGNWVISNETQQIYTLGSYVESNTASGVVRAWGAGETPPDACDAPVFESDEDPGFDYGDFVSSSYSEEVIPFEDIIPDAIAAIEVDGSIASSAQEWPSESWEDVSKGVIAFSQYLGAVAAFVTQDFDVVPGEADGAVATRTRFRLRNAGDCMLRVNCGFYGSGLPGGATDDARDIYLPKGAQTGWIESAAVNPDPLKGLSASIQRVRIGPWKYVA